MIEIFRCRIHFRVSARPLHTSRTRYRRRPPVTLAPRPRRSENSWTPMLTDSGGQTLKRSVELISRLRTEILNGSKVKTMRAIQ